MNESCKANSNYPRMNDYDWDSAPFNEHDNIEREIEVEVTLTLKKTVKIKVDDYISNGYEKDEDGNCFDDIDYSSCNIEKAVDEQIVLPQDAKKYISANTDMGKKAYKDLSDWELLDIDTKKI